MLLRKISIHSCQFEFFWGLPCYGYYQLPSVARRALNGTVHQLRNAVAPEVCGSVLESYIHPPAGVWRQAAHFAFFVRRRETNCLSCVKCCTTATLGPLHPTHPLGCHSALTDSRSSESLLSPSPPQPNSGVVLWLPSAECQLERCGFRGSRNRMTLSPWALLRYTEHGGDRN